MKDIKLYYIWLSLVVDFTSTGISDFFKSSYSIFHRTKQESFESDFKDEMKDDFSVWDILVRQIYENRKDVQKNLGFLKESEKNAFDKLPLSKAVEVLSSCEKGKIDVIYYTSDSYPEKLRNIYNPPLVLYRKGKYKNVDDCLSIAVVGTRKPSGYAVRATALISQDLAISNAVVVSGHAIGIDSAAHQGALDAKGYTVSFAGCGLDVDYPMGNSKLRKDITENGVIYSEYPPKIRPNGWHFPIRNRLISGFSDGVLVTEGYYHSGSIHTARHALEQGRDVFALPGDIFSPKSEATFKLLKEGASPVMSALDILEHYLLRYGKTMNFVGVRRNYHGGLGTYTPLAKKSRGSKKPDIKKKSIVVVNNDVYLTSEDLLKKGLQYEDIKIYNCLIKKNKHVDEIVNEMELDISTVLSCLTRLEIEGIVISLRGRMYGIKSI